MLIKRSERDRNRGSLAGGPSTELSGDLDRRCFLKRSGVAAGALAALGNLPPDAVLARPLSLASYPVATGRPLPGHQRRH